MTRQGAAGSAHPRPEARTHSLCAAPAYSSWTSCCPTWRTRCASGAPDAADSYAEFIDVIDQDARKALAAVRLVLGRPAISSQLIDNLNGSIHLRALLTDLFIIDESLKEGGPGDSD